MSLSHTSNMEWIWIRYHPKNVNNTNTSIFGLNSYILKHISSPLPQKPFRKLCFLNNSPPFDQKVRVGLYTETTSANAASNDQKAPTTSWKSHQCMGHHGSHGGGLRERFTPPKLKIGPFVFGGFESTSQKVTWHLRCNAILKKCSLSSWRKKAPVSSDFSWEMVSIRLWFLESLLWWFTGKWDVSTRMFSLSLVILHRTMIMENGRQGYAGLKDKHMDLWWPLKQRWCEPFYLKWYCSPYATYMFQKYSYLICMYIFHIPYVDNLG